MNNGITLERPQIASLVLSSLKNILIENEYPNVETVAESTSLLGDRAVLDSLGLVTLLVDLEQQFDEEYGISLTLADERALSQKNSPFRTVQALINYVCQLMQEFSLDSVGA